MANRKGLSVKEIHALRKHIAGLNITFFGKMLYYCVPFRRRVVLDNINLVFGEVLDDSEIQKLALAFYSHIASSLAENIKMRFMSTETISRHAEIRGHEKVIQAAEAGKGVLILTGHFGNWEFAPIAGLLNFNQYFGRFHFVRKSIRLKWLESLLFKRFYQAGLHVIPKKNSLQRVLEVLENNDVVVFVMDQAASVSDRIGVAAKFFGKPAGTYKSLASIARMNIPVIPASAFRAPNGRHVLQFYDPIPWQEHESSKQEILNNTQQYNDALEKMVLSRPEQWFWMHRRWKMS